MKEKQITRRIAALLLAVAAIAAIAFPGCDELVTEVNEITIAGNPTADFDITDTTRYFCCAPCSVQFVDLSNGPRDSWLWRFGDGDSSTDTTPSHIYDSAGIYTVILTVRDSETQGSDTEVKKRFIIAGTAVQGMSLSADSGCAPLLVDFAPVEAGGDTSFAWNFGDGSAVNTSREPSHIYSDPGRYEVSLTVEGDCGQAVVTDSIIVSDCPEIQFAVGGGVTALCIGDSVTFEDITSPAESLVVVAYEWDFGDGNQVQVGDTALQTTVQHAYDNSGLYDVEMTIVTVDSTLSDSTRYSVVREEYISVFDSANAAFTMSKTAACFSATQQFLVLFDSDCDTLCGLDSSRWTFGDGTGDTATSPIHAFTSPNVYEIRHMVWGCGADTVIDTVTLANSVSASFTIAPSDSGDNNTVFTLTDQSGAIGATREWNMGDGSAVLTDSTINYRYTDTTGAFIVQMTLQNACGTFVAEDTITVTAATK